MVRYEQLCQTWDIRFLQVLGTWLDQRFTTYIKQTPTPYTEDYQTTAPPPQKNPHPRLASPLVFSASVP